MATTQKEIYAMVFDGIDLPDSLRKIIEMSLEDGIITDRERALIKKKAISEGLDEDLFDFYFEKIEERYTDLNKRLNNPIKILREAFDAMKKIAEGGKGIFPVEQLGNLLSSLPGIGQMPTQGSGGNDVMKTVNKVAGGITNALSITTAVGTVLNVFIKEPSNLNNLKAEVIRNLKIPNDIDLIAEFLDYADASIIEEKEIKKAKSGLSSVSNFVAGAETDLIPIWKLKMKQTVDKAKKEFHNEPHLLERIKKYIVTATDKLKKLINETAGLPVKTSSLFLKIELPHSRDEYMELMNFVKTYAKSSDPRAHEFKDYLMQLQEEAKLRFPGHLDEIEAHSIKTSPLQKMKDSLKKSPVKIVISETKIPEDESDFFEMISFVETQSKGSTSDAVEFKNFLEKMYNYGVSNFKNREEDLSAYRPRSIEILKKRLSQIAPIDEGIKGFFGSDKNRFTEEVKKVLRNFPTPTNFVDFLEIMAFAKNSFEYDENAKDEYLEFLDRLYSEGIRMFPEKRTELNPYKIPITEKFKKYQQQHNLSEAISAFPIPSDEEEFFELMSYSKTMHQTDNYRKDDYKRFNKRLYLEGKGRFDEDKLKKYKIKSFGIFKK